jgi:5'-methylthioadenosine phosphorylase
MTAMPEAKLAREAELPYCTLALVTDYDCWHATQDAVSVEAVIAVLKKNSELAKRALAELAPALPDPKRSPAATALQTAILTPLDKLDSAAHQRLGWLLKPYLEN